jgi:hypothetical protein
MLNSPPTEWPEPMLNAWLKLVCDTDGLLFNDDTVSLDVIMKCLDTRPK